MGKGRAGYGARHHYPRAGACVRLRLPMEQRTELLGICYGAVPQHTTLLVFFSSNAKLRQLVAHK